jgi:hypothetical protein
MENMGANNGKVGEAEIKTSIYYAVPDGKNG